MTTHMKRYPFAVLGSALVLLMVLSQPAMSRELPVRWPTVSWNADSDYIGVNTDNGRVTTQHRLRTGVVDVNVEYFDGRVRTDDVRVLGIQIRNGHVVLPNRVR